MIHQPRSTSVLFSLAMTLVLTGCVTPGDLKQLESRLSERLQAMEARTQSQVGAMRTTLEEVQAAQVSMGEEVTQGLSQTRADAKEAMEAVTQSQLSLSQVHEALQAEIGQNREALSQYAGKSAAALQMIADHTARVSMEMKGFREGMMESLMGSYRAEEAALRERLRAMVETRQKLESLAGPTDVKGRSPNSDPKETMVLDQRETLGRDVE